MHPSQTTKNGSHGRSGLPASVNAMSDENVEAGDVGVAGNARLTGFAGALIFLLLAVEGFTILHMGSQLALHIFVGMVLVPLALLKTVSTGYRFARYYLGDDAYERKGAPPLLLRLAGP